MVVIVTFTLYIGVSMKNFEIAYSLALVGMIILSLLLVIQANRF